MYAILLALALTLTQFHPAPFAQMHRPVPPAHIFMNSPLSGSVLVAHAIWSGQVRIPYVYPQLQVLPNVLTCTPAPCTTPNVQASGGGSPVNEDPIAASPLKAKNLLSGGNDYNCPNLQGFYSSSNGGTSWLHTCLNAASGSGAGDPAVGYDLNGNSYIAGIDQTGGNSSIISMEKSSNNGTTWSAPFVTEIGVPPYTFVDKEWLQIDVTATSPFKNDMYLSSTDFDASSNSAIVVAHSTDGGVTWTEVMVDHVVYPTVDQFSDLGIGSDGVVYLGFMRCVANGPTGDCGGTKAKEMFSKSTDGGATWSPVVKMATAHLAPDTCSAFYGCLPGTSERVSDIPSIDVDRSSGPNHNRIYASFYNYNGSKMQVKVVTSTNGGTTWNAPVLVSGATTGDQFFPWLNVDNVTGDVGVTWLDRRLDPANHKYDSFAALSTDGGATIGTNVRMSTVSSDPNNDGFGGGFMGDYTGNAWAGNKLFQSWMDTRTGVSQDEVGAYRIR